MCLESWFMAPSLILMDFLIKPIQPLNFDNSSPLTVPCTLSLWVKNDKILLQTSHGTHNGEHKVTSDQEFVDNQDNFDEKRIFKITLQEFKAKKLRYLSVRLWKQRRKKIIKLRTYVLPGIRTKTVFSRKIVRIEQFFFLTKIKFFEFFVTRRKVAPHFYFLTIDTIFDTNSYLKPLDHETQCEYTKERELSRNRN